MQVCDIGPPLVTLIDICMQRNNADATPSGVPLVSIGNPNANGISIIGVSMPQDANVGNKAKRFESLLGLLRRLCSAAPSHPCYDSVLPETAGIMSDWEKFGCLNLGRHCAALSCPRLVFDRGINMFLRQSQGLTIGNTN
jgi:hypothetical protein